MEWEVSLHLITDNMSINHKYVFFFQARKRQKQEQVHCEQRRMQSSVLEGQESGWREG